MLQLNAVRPKKNMALYAFLMGIFIAAAFFVPYIVLGNGYFLFYGDFNVQQVPFYALAHDAIRSGNIGWSSVTDLGANFIGSYSFYLLGSPFFLITLLFPNSFLPYLMGPLFILKFGCATLTAYLYIKRYVRRQESAVLGALLYAFSGYSIYNIFYNHFHEAIIVFPLLLLAMDMLIAERKRGIFGAMVFLAAITNYFFFYGMVVFCVIYWFIKTIGGSYKQNLRCFALMVLEAVLGLLMAMALLLPSILSVLQNDRLSSVSLGYDSWLYGRVQIYANILEVLFFPPDIPARPVFFPGADVKWSSLGAWLPLFSVTGVLAFMKSQKKHWISKILKVSLFMALVPILNAAFSFFNSAYYARWFFMPILIMCLGTVMAIENHEVDWKPAFRTVSIITVVTSLIIGLWPEGKNDDGSITHFGIYTYEEGSYTYIARFATACGIAIASLLVLWLLLKAYRKYYELFVKNAITAVAIISVIYSAIFIGCGKAHSYDIKNEVIPNLIEGELKLEGDPDTFRIDCYECMDNTAMFLGYSSINAFHSIVPASVTEFYEYIGESRSVASRPSTDCAGIRPLLSVKYLLTRENGESFQDEDGNNKMEGYKFLKTENGFNVYENENYIPYGFTYDYYATKETADEVSDYLRPNLMVRAMLLDDTQIKKYSKILKDIETDSYILCSEQLAEDSAARKKTAAEKFEFTNSGFNSEITLERDNLVFFSVPYEDGWKAYVNGSPVEIEKVNVGFMAVYCKEGKNQITFQYTTPGLYLGILISVIGAVMFCIYLFSVKLYRRRHPYRYCGEWPEGEKLAIYFKNNPELFPPKEEPEPVETTEPPKEEEDTGSTYIDVDALHKFIGEKEDE